MESSSSNNGDRIAVHDPPSQPHTESEDYVNNNKENGGFHPANWLLGGGQPPSQQPPTRLAAADFRRRRGGSEEEEEEGAASGRDSEESEEDKYGSSPRLLLDRDLNMNRGSGLCDAGSAPKGSGRVMSGPADYDQQPPHPLVDQLRAVTERIGQLVSEAGRTDNPRTLQDLAVLQTTLFSLQQQQLLQMQILAHMQNQMKSGGEAGDVPPAPPAARSQQDSDQQLAQHRFLARQKEQEDVEAEARRQRRREQEEQGGQQQQHQPPLRKLQDLIGPRERSGGMKSGGQHSDHHSSQLSISPGSGKTPGVPPYGGQNTAGMLQQRAVAASEEQAAGGFFPADRPPFSASILAPGDQADHANSPLNSLELLQQKAQGILNNASHGLLKNSLADLSYSKSASKDDPHFKHRCKFCGKVFGSDSALQIHIRFVFLR
jgi:hypothetical protein